MKAAAFNYQKASSVREALDLLQQHGDMATLMAGGQSLLPALNMRLSAPDILIDLNGVEELKGITITGNVLRIGAMTTHTEIENSELIRNSLPLLSMAVPHIAHRAIRNLGTWGGSIVYGDPAAEWPACAIALNGTMVIATSEGERKISAKDFFQDLYTTDLQVGEILVATEFEIKSSSSLSYFDELARRHGDYAVAGISMQLQHDRGIISDSRIVFFSVASVPALAAKTQEWLKGKTLTSISDADLSELKTTVRSEIETMSDLTNSAAMKSHLVGVLLERAIQQLQKQLS